MADVAWADVVTVDLSLADVPPWAQDLYLSEANALNPRAFDGEAGPRFRLARILLAAHRGRRQLNAVGTGAAAGPVTAEAVDRMSTSYAAPAVTSSTAADFYLTPWGQQYAALCHASPRARLGAR